MGTGSPASEMTCNGVVSPGRVSKTVRSISLRRTTSANAACNKDTSKGPAMRAAT